MRLKANPMQYRAYSWPCGALIVKPKVKVSRGLPSCYEAAERLGNGVIGVRLPYSNLTRCELKELKMDWWSEGMKVDDLMSIKF